MKRGSECTGCGHRVSGVHAWASREDAEGLMRRSSAHGVVQPGERPGKMHMQLQRMYHVVIHTSE